MFSVLLSLQFTFTHSQLLLSFLERKGISILHGNVWCSVHCSLCSFPLITPLLRTISCSPYRAVSFSRGRPSFTLPILSLGKSLFQAEARLSDFVDACCPPQKLFWEDSLRSNSLNLSLSLSCSVKILTCTHNEHVVNRYYCFLPLF